MRRPALALLKKELRQHGLALAGIVGLSGVAFWVFVLANQADVRAMSDLSVTAQFVAIWLVAPALVLGNRLLVTEYYARTQLFVETLPISRSKMAAVKYGLGLVVLLSLSASSLVGGLVMAARTEPIDASFALHLWTRVALSTLAYWGIFFAMGFLGRWRSFFYVLSFFVVAMLSGVYQFDFAHFGPIELMNPSVFGLVRGPPEARAVWQTLGLAGAGLALGLLLATINEGSLAETMAKRLTHRDFSMMAIIGIGVLAAAVVLEKRVQPEPFEFVEKAVIRHEQLPIEIMYLDDRYLPQAKLLGTGLVALLTPLDTELQLSQPVPVRVAYGGMLDVHRYQSEKMAREEGIFYRANFTSPQWDLLRFSQTLVHALLARHSNGRASLESRHWFLDGFSWYWPLRHVEDAEPATPAANADVKTATAPPRRADALLSRARRAVASRGAGLDDIEAWARLSEREGDAGSGAIAYSLVHHMADRHGHDAIMDLARKLYREPAPRNISAVLSERKHPIARRFEQTTGESWPAFVRSWEGWVRDPHDHSDPWGFSPVGHMGQSSREGLQVLRYRFQFDAPPPAGALCSIVHTPLAPFDLPLSPTGLRRKEHLCRKVAGRDLELSGALSQGGRTFAALEVEVPERRYFMRILARRWEALP